MIPPKVLTIKEGRKDDLEKAIIAYDQIANGTLGFSGQAKLFVELGFDKQCLVRRGKRWPKKRLRIKRMKRVLQNTYRDAVLDCFVGFNRA